MKTIEPLLAKLALKEKVQSLVAPPYDVVTYQQVKSHLAQEPNSILQVTRPDGLFDTPNIPQQQILQKATQALNRLAQQNYQPSYSSCYLLYEISCPQQTQLGLFCMANSNALKKHELTTEAKVQDRIHLNQSLQSQISPVMVCTDPMIQLSTQLLQLKETATPYFKVNYQNQIHSLYLVKAGKTCDEVSEFINSHPLYIADGHHRSQTQSTLHQQHPDKFTANILSVIFPGEILNILGYHRIISIGNNIQFDELQIQLTEYFSFKKSDEAILPNEKTHFGCYFNQQWYNLIFKESSDNLLAVSLLHKYLIEPIFEITDLRHDKRISYVGGFDACQQIETQLADHQNKIAFTISPITVEDIVQTANNQQTLPPKSTYFEPKLLDGFLIQAG